MAATRLPATDSGPLTPVWGQTWQDAAWRGCAVFVLGYVLPRLIVGHAVAGLQWPASFACFGLLAMAIFRYQESTEFAAETLDEDVVLLPDAAVNPSTLDAVVAAGARPQASKPRKWSVELLHTLEWRRMVDVCLAFYKERGLSGAQANVNPDGSVNVPLYQGERSAESNALPPFALLHCKVHGEQVVGVEAIVALQEEMAEAGVSRAFFMGVRSFDEAAVVAAKSAQITLIDDRMFLSMLGRLPAEESQRLLNVAVEGDYITPSCPGCGLKMIPRQNEKGRYWGCRAFPRCKSILGMQG